MTPKKRTKILAIPGTWDPALDSRVRPSRDIREFQLLKKAGLMKRIWGALSASREFAGYIGGKHTSYGRAIVPGTDRNYLKEIAHRINAL